jgi:methyl-accepting chemotaxis protein-2 (aspartate sensor receptor)
MKAMRNIKINTAMLGLLAILAVMMAAAIGLRMIAETQTADYLTTIQRVDIDQLDAVNAINNEQSLVRSRMAGMLDDVRAHRQPDRAELRAVAGALDAMDGLLQKFNAVQKSPEQQKLASAISGSAGDLIKTIRGQAAAIEKGDLDAFNALNEQMVAPARQFHDSLAALAHYAGQRNAVMIADFNRTDSLFKWLYRGLALFTLLLLPAVYLGLRRLVVIPLTGAVKRLDAIARADLSEHIGVQGDNEIGRLFAAMRRMQQSLGKIVREARGSSNSIYVGASEIARGNADLSARTEEQAASLEETATSMEQITATVKQNADNARQASSLANDASATASHGGEVMDQVTATMRGISDSSKKVAEITGMIDSIAFQTNILALNASVEAARAGEQGRGFAVVAGEVRNLAGRSAEAAREIKQLIESSSQQVSGGSALVEQAGHTMREVVSAVKRVTDIMDEISAASQEQSSGIEQINQAVGQMDEVTQQNAALVEQITAAAASLEEQACRLESSVAVFRLPETPPQAAAQGRPSAARPSDQDASTMTQRVKRPVAPPPRQASKAGGDVRASRLEPATAEDGWEEF